MKRLLLCLLLSILCLQQSAAGRCTLPFNDNWNFRFAHQVSGPGHRVNLPHTWNSGDALSGNSDYYRGTGIYEKHLTLNPEWSGKRIFLRFEGANEVADVFVNDRFVGEHRGGYGAFVFDITDFLDSDRQNTIMAKVSNSLHLDIMPLVGDFNMYGGIYRNVSLIVTDPIHISLTDYASSGVYLSQRNVSDKHADVVTTVVLSNDSNAPVDATIKLTVNDGHRNIVSLNNPVTLPADSTTRVTVNFGIDNPRLWDGSRDPFMYSASVELIGPDGTVCDRVDQPLGLRYYNVDANNGFTLNGKHLKLKGVCRHQDRAELGNALYPQHHAEDAAIINEMGANAVRLAHYPHAEEFYSLMDRYGIIVWAEIPFIGPGGYHDRGYNNIPAFRKNGQEQLREMIRQHYNHPSICFWGLFNELKTHGDNPLDYIAELNKIAHGEDSTRLTTAASFLDKDPINTVTDLIAWNKYYGWYGGSPEDLGRWLDATHTASPDFKIGISEYGAGASVYHQQDSVMRGDASGWWHPENYQTDYHIRNWKTIEKRPFVWGSFIWNLFDFGAAHRTEGDRPGINDKGLVTFDRKIKKDAFYFYKANWNKTDPFVYISNRRHSKRTQSKTTVTVFSNEPEVELTVNGKIVGRRISDGFGVFTFDGVELTPGENIIIAVSVKKKQPVSDTVTWHLIR
ncbi:MAG: glycoside hydrolase family 2 protein [Paramuribaculum sp.]|nr:glycoside hydrolase family 2 protein [Paramuribaculum sp.]